jgi:hypothetical protein
MVIHVLRIARKRNGNGKLIKTWQSVRVLSTTTCRQSPATHLRCILQARRMAQKLSKVPLARLMADACMLKTFKHPNLHIPHRKIAPWNTLMSGQRHVRTANSVKRPRRSLVCQTKVPCKRLPSLSMFLPRILMLHEQRVRHLLRAFRLVW